MDFAHLKQLQSSVCISNDVAKWCGLPLDPSRESGLQHSSKHRMQLMPQQDPVVLDGQPWYFEHVFSCDACGELCRSDPAQAGPSFREIHCWVRPTLPPHADAGQDPIVGRMHECRREDCDFALCAECWADESNRGLPGCAGEVLRHPPDMLGTLCTGPDRSMLHDLHAARQVIMGLGTK